MIKEVRKLPHKYRIYPNSKFHGANMWPIWGRQDPGGSHVGSMNFAVWVSLLIYPVRNGPLVQE